MNRTLICLCALILSMGLVYTQEKSEADLAEAELRKGIMGTADDARQVAFIKPFVLKYPDHPRAGLYMKSAVEMLLNSLDKPKGALALAESFLAKATDGKSRFEGWKALALVYGHMGDQEKLLRLEKKASESKKFEYWDRRAFADAAFTGEMWELALTWYDKALELSTIEHMQALLKPKNWTDEQIESLAFRRATPAYIFKARVMAELNRLEEAQNNFEKAASVALASFFGEYDNELNLHWGRFLVSQQRFSEAAELLAPPAIMGHNEEAIGLLKQAYDGKAGGKDGFPTFLSSLRKSLQKPAVDFTLKDYSGQTVSLSSLKGSVVLLNFWFPHCGPCRVELPRIKEMYARLREKGLVIVCFDTTAERDAAKKFIETHELPYVFTDKGESGIRVDHKYNVHAAPTNFIIDKRGFVVDYKLGFEVGDEVELEKTLLDLLSE